MYCKICGTEINPTDLFCKVCGTKIEKTEPQEQSIESAESKHEDHEDFTWNIYEFPKPRKTENIDFQWNLNALEEKEKEINEEELSNNDKEISLQSLDIKLKDEEKIEWELPKKEPIKEDIIVSSFEDLPGSRFKNKIPEEKNPEEKNPEEANPMEIENSDVNDMDDKFFTFSKKNEEFQQLLDREYEKIQKKNLERPSLKESQISTVMNDLDSPKQEMSKSFLTKEEDIDDIDDTKRIDTKEIKKISDYSDKLSPISFNHSFENENIESEMAVKLAAHANHLEEMMAARASFFDEVPEEEKKDKPPILHTDGDTLVGPNTEVLVTVEVKANGKSETVTRQTISMDPAVISAEAKKEEEKEALPFSFDKDKSSKEKFVSEDILHTQTSDAEIVNREKKEKQNSDTIEESEQKEKVEEEGDEKTPDLKNTLSQDDLTKFWQKNTFGMEEKKPVNKLKVALGIIAVILAAEIATLGIQYFFPKSSAAGAINHTQSKIIQVFAQAGEGIDKIFNLDEKPNEKEEDDTLSNQQEKNNETADEPDPNPMADKNALIESQTKRNKNIQVIAESESRVFDSSHDYGIEDLNNSKPIDNNIWYTDEDGNTFYYDQSVVGALIAFNSQWIDYVNNKDNSILDLLKPNSKGYNKVVSFTKAGKITEVFESFSIGDIRQGSTGFYVFTEELIKKTENGKNYEIPNKWIYYLEPIDQNMMVVNYF